MLIKVPRKLEAMLNRGIENIGLLAWKTSPKDKKHLIKSVSLLYFVKTRFIWENKPKLSVNFKIFKLENSVFPKT